MTAAQMISYFDLLTDKVGSAYFLASEKYEFINNASIEYIKQLLPSSEGGVVNIEEDQVVFNNISSLVFETSALNSSSGVISRATLQNALDTASGSTESIMYVLNCSWTKSGTTYPVKYTRHNDHYAFEKNSFKAGSATAPRYRQLGTTFKFTPTDDAASIKFTLLKTPKAISGSVDSDMPEHTHKKIVELAVDIASASLRDGDLKQLVQ